MDKEIEEIVERNNKDHIELQNYLEQRAERISKRDGFTYSVEDEFRSILSDYSNFEPNEYRPYLSTEIGEQISSAISSCFDLEIREYDIERGIAVYNAIREQEIWKEFEQFTLELCKKYNTHVMNIEDFTAIHDKFKECVSDPLHYYFVSTPNISTAYFVKRIIIELTDTKINEFDIDYID